MPRIAGVDVPDKKKILYALQYLHGIGPKFAAAILTEANIDPDIKANELTDQQVAQLNGVIDGVIGRPARAACGGGRG